MKRRNDGYSFFVKVETSFCTVQSTYLPLAVNVYFRFSGTGLALRIQGGPYWAYDRIAVDGEPANALPRDETGASYLVLHDPLGRPRWVTVARDLPAGQHSVHLEATGGWGQWALQGVRVTAAASRPVWAAWSLLGLALLATLLWLALAWPFRRSATGWLRSRLDAAAAWPEPLLWFAAAALALLLILTRNFALDHMFAQMEREWTEVPAMLKAIGVD